MSKRHFALAACERGLRVFPIPPGQTVPRVKFSETSSSHATDIRRIWRSENSRKNIGIHTGNGFFVVDVDVQAGGDKTIAALIHEHGPLPQTYCVATPSGGWHFYFTSDEDIRNSASTKLGQGIDVRGHNGFVVGEGSYRDERTKDDGTLKPGGDYAAVSTDPIAAAPQWLVDMALGPNLENAVTGLSDGDSPLIDVPEGQRNDRLFKEGASLRGKGWAKQAIYEALSARNNTFTRPVSTKELKLIAHQASQYTPNSTYEPPTALPSKHPAPVDAEERRPVRLRPLNTYTSRKVNFLWRGLFPLNSVSIIAGDPGQAKTSFMLKIGSAITTGAAPLEGAPRAPQGAVVFATAEDSIDHTVLPRVLAAGGDVSQFYIVDNVDFDLIDDREAMSNALKAIGKVRLLIVDPITAYMSKGADGNSNTDVRVALRSLQDLAEDFDMAVVGISHLNKDTRKSVFARLLGSVGWVAAPRAVYLANENPDLPGQSVVACAKTNFEPPEPVAFRKAIVEVETDEGPATQVVTELEEYEGGLSIDELFAAKDTKISKVEEARRWLRDRLGTGEWVAASVLDAEVQQSCNFSWRTVNSAKKKLAIHTERREGAWWWHMDALPGVENLDDSIVFGKGAR